MKFTLAASQFRVARLAMALGALALATASLSPTAAAEGKDATIDGSSTSKRLGGLPLVALTNRPSVTVYEDHRAGTGRPETKFQAAPSFAFVIDWHDDMTSRLRG